MTAIAIPPFPRPLQLLHAVPAPIADFATELLAASARLDDTGELSGEEGEIENIKSADVAPGEEGGIHQLAEVGQEAERRDPPDHDQPASVISEDENGDRCQDGGVDGGHAPLRGDEVAPVLEQRRENKGGHGYKGKNADRAISLPEGQDGDEDGEHRADLLDEAAEHGPPQ